MKAIQILHVIFKLVCISAAICMIGFWIYEFEKNEDITLVEYKSTREMINVTYPELSICIDQPFLNKELAKFSADLDRYKYLKHLRGETGFNETYNNIPYDQITPNLYDHLQRLWIGWKPGRNHLKDNNCTDPNNCQYFVFTNHFNGMSDFTFLKCFGIHVKKKYTQDVLWFQLIFNESLKSVLTQVKGISIMMNKPNQFSLNMGGVQNIWDSPKGKKRKEFFQINSIEILKRRNKVQKPCNEEWANFDDLALTHHMKKVGCRPPYQKAYERFPTCKTQREMKESIYDPWILDGTDIPVPCQEMPNIIYSHDYKDTDIDFKVPPTFKIWVAYPKKGKIITESQAVNIHSLIGNIGGYIGLFLGTFYFDDVF